MALLVFEIGMLILVTYITFPPFSSDPFPLCGAWGGGPHGLVISSCWVDTGNQAPAPGIYARSLGQCLFVRVAGGEGGHALSALLKRQGHVQSPLHTRLRVRGILSTYK